MTVTYPVALTDANVVALITTDPFSVGLAAIRTANPGADAPLLAAMSSTTGPGTGTKSADPITAAELMDLVNSSDFATLSTQQLAQLQTILSAQTINVGDAPTQGKLSALFASYSTSLTAIQSAYTQPSSPWERAFGAGQVPTQQILDSARNSGSGNNF